MSGQHRAAASLLFPGETSGTPWISGQAGLTAGLDAIERDKSLPYRESNLDSHH
jgi:hypothetical protein